MTASIGGGWGWGGEVEDFLPLWGGALRLGTPGSSAVRLSCVLLSGNTLAF